MAMGLLLTAPPPTMSPDKLPASNLGDAELEELRAKRHFPPGQQSHPEWEPVAPLEGKEQWDVVHDNWQEPAWGMGEDGSKGFVSKWAEVFKWDMPAMSQLAAIPTRLEKGFMDPYVAAPLVTN